MKTDQVSYHQHFQVRFDYPVVFTRNLFAPGNSALAGTLYSSDEPAPQRVVIFVDSEVVRLHSGLLDDIRTYFEMHSAQFKLVRPPRPVPGGEQIKNDYRLVMEIVDTILEYQLCRHSIVIAIGGGAVLDTVGFGTSIVHRGLRLVRMPTTVLSQNDGGVGIKNGMNLHGGKNTIGTFHPPFAVFNDFSFLKTLSDTHWRGGIAEAFKVAIIKDRNFFDFLCEKAPLLRARDDETMEYLIRHCAELHLEHIRTNGDPFEYGKARPLDFGHWAAHKLECMSGYRIGHGQAVAFGIALDSHYAMQKGWLSESEFLAIRRGLMESGLPLWYDCADRRLGKDTLELLGGLHDFQEHLGGTLCVTLPQGLGCKFEVHEIEHHLVSEAIAYFKGLHESHISVHLGAPGRL